jgi:hypothetical protein
MLVFLSPTRPALGWETLVVPAKAGTHAAAVIMGERYAALFSRLPVVMGPCVRVWSREISECFDWGEIVEAFEASSIVIIDETREEGIAVQV